MAEAERIGSRSTRWVVRVAAALAVVAIGALVVALAIHSAPVRRYALNRAITTLEQSARIRLSADALTYNLFGLRMTLTGVRVAAVSAPDAPFFVAERVSVALQGGFHARVTQDFRLASEDQIDIEAGRVRILRSADGRLNLPESGDAAGEPEAISLGTVTAPRLALEFIDEADHISLVLPAVDVRLRGDEGRIELRDEGRFARADTSTTIRELRGALGFDGRIVTLKGFHAGFDEAAFSVDGQLAVLAERPRADLRITGRGDVARLARWSDLTEPPQGDVQFEAAVAGPFGAVGADVKARMSDLRWQGVTASNLSSSLRVTRDALDVRQFDADAFGGRVTAAGTMPFENGHARATVSWADLDIETVMRTFAADVLPRPTGRATGGLQAEGPGGDLERWTIEAQTRTARGITGRNRVALDGVIDLRVDQRRWRVRADQRVGGIPAQATMQGALNTARLERSTIGGTITIPEVASRAVLDLVRRTGLAEVDVADVDGTIRTDIAVSGTLGAPAIAARGTGHIADLAPLAPNTPVAGPADLEFEATLREARLRGLLHDFNASVDGVIALQAPYHATFDITAPSVDLGRALRGTETPVKITGTIGATAHVSAPLDNVTRARATLDVSRLEARAGELSIRLATPARLGYADGIVNVPSLDLFAGDTRIAASGRLPISGTASSAEALQLTATGDLAQFTSAIAATGVVELPDVSGTGPAALLARITGSFEQPHVAADLELGPGTLKSADVPAATNVHVRAHSDGEWVDLHELSAAWQGSRIEATGRLPLEWAGLEAGSYIEKRESTGGRGRPSGRPIGTITARLSSLTPQVLAPFVDAETLSQIDGSVDASLRLHSEALDLASLAGDVQLDRMDIRVTDLPISQRVPTRIVFENGFARVAAWDWLGQGGSLGVEGRVNLANQQAALLATGRFDLRMLTPFVRDAGMTTAGTIEPRLSITGVLTDPRVDGDVAVRSGELRLADPRVVATGLAARAVVSRTAARITQLTGFVNGGTLSGTGNLAFAPHTSLEATLALAVDRMALEFPEGLRSELNAALGIKVTIPEAEPAEPTGSVTGTVTVLRSAYREPLAVVAGLLNALRTRQLAGQAYRAEPSIIDKVALDVRVLTEEDIIVDNNLGRLQLGADLRVIGTVAAPSVAGRAQLREGGRLFLGRNIYVIDSGTIDFANPVTVEPDLNIQARTRAGGEDIVLILKGAPDNLETELDAPDAPELGEADLYSLLLTGRTLDKVSGDEAEILGQQMLGYLSGDVLGIASRAVGLDTIRLGGIDEDVLRRDPTAVATELDPTTRLTFGKSFGPDFDVTYSQSLRESDAQAWILDYRPLRSVETRFVSDDEDLRSYEVRHDVSIGGGSLSDTAAASGASERPELRVTTVTVQGTGPIPERRVLSELQLTTGETFDFGEWQRDRERLEALYHAEHYYEVRVGTERKESEAGIALTYAIAPGPRAQIEVLGHELGGDTLARIRTAWSQSVVDEFLVDEVRDVVARDLAGAGYLQAKVDVSFRLEPEATSGTGKTLSITIAPGPRVTSYAVDVHAPDPALVEELTDMIGERGLARAAATDPAMLEREVTAHLRERGYLQTRVTAGVPTHEDGRAELRVDVEPGQVFTIANVSFAGASRVPTQTLLTESQLIAGTPLAPAAVDRARERILALYRREGFASARVNVQQVPRDVVAGVDVAFTIEEGPRQVVAQIDVQGSRVVNTDVVTRALDLKINQPLAADAWLQARRRVFDTGLFRRVDVSAEPIGLASPDADMQPMRVRVTVQPWPALRVRYGFQVAEERPEGEEEGRELVPGVSADITRRTLFGRAVTLGAAFDYQRREKSGRAFMSTPTMFGWPVESLLAVERSRETLTAQTLTTDRAGLSLEQRYRLRPKLRLSVTYRLTRDHTFDTGPPDEIVGPVDLIARVARLNSSLALDTRNDPVDTTRGLLFSSSFEYAPAALGSDFRFVKYLAQAYHFKPWRRLVFASAARLGLASALDDQLLLLSERFTAGGPHTVRGAEDDGLGPRDFFGPTGGESLVVLNQEMRFPIYGWVRGLVFVDAGNVFAEPSDTSLGELVGSFGFGLRLATPFALLRVDYGRLFSPGPDGVSGRWIAGLGHAF